MDVIRTAEVTSLAVDCEGREKLGQFGWIWGRQGLLGYLRVHL
jgi:hypothetical protein